MQRVYYVNKNTASNPNHDHEVHHNGCSKLPSSENRIYLGSFDSCSAAVNEAKKHYSNVDGCVICCPTCHKS